MSSSLHTKYRPAKLSQVVGQASAKEVLGRSIKNNRARAYLFEGPSGVGKTTLARILASEIGVREDNILEVDAASRSGVEATRELATFARFRGMGESGQRCCIIDEAHRLSKQAWDALLKPIEEPPPHMTWVLCTTELKAVPRTIQTRTLKITLGDVPDQAILALLKRVCKAEGFRISKGIAKAVVEYAKGSPREALVGLEMVCECSKTSEAYQLLDRIEKDNAEAIELCRVIQSGASLEKTLRVVAKFKGQRVESVRHVVLAYFTSVAIGEKTSPGKRDRAVEVLAAFNDPFPNEPGIHPLILAVSECVE